MTVRSLNGLNGTTTNVYLNRDPIEATLPVQAIQTTVNDPITISLKGLSGFGTVGQIIKVNSAGDALIYADEPTADTTIESNFGTASTTDPVKLGNTAGQSIGLELYFNILKLKNNSGVQIATFTPVSNTCDLDLNGGLLKTFTASTNATWNGIPIAYNYGGTGLSSLVANKLLQVNSSANGYDLVDFPTSGQWTLNGTNLYPISSLTNVVINSTTNTDNRSLLVNGDCDIKDKLFLSSTSNAEIQIDNTSQKGIHFNSGSGYGFKLFADMTYNGAAIINVLNSTAPILQLESIDTTYHKFSVGSTETYSNSSNFTRNYFVKSSNNNIGTYIENNFTDDTFNLKTFSSTYDESFMTVDLTNNNQRTTLFEKCSQFTISSGAGANGDCTLLIRADTDNAVETANPIIKLQQDGASVEATIELGDNDLSIHTTGGSSSIILNPAITLQITKTTSITGDLKTFSTSNLARNYFIDTTTPTEGRYIENNFSTNTFNLRNFTSTYDEAFMTVDLTNNDRRTTTFEKCATFTISSGAGANGDCTLFIKADTDNQVETANPAIVLQQDILGSTAYVEGTIELNTDNNLKISITEGVGSGGKIVLDPDDEVNVAGVLNVDGTIKGADESMVFEVSGANTYFYSEKYSGDSTRADSIFAYPSNGSAIYFNLSSGGTSAGYYYGFATGETQKAQIGMNGTARITGSWTGSWAGTSDRRLKENIVPIENAIETLMKINVYQFDKYDIDNFDCIHHDNPCELDCLKPFKERLSKDTRFVYGFIAQELWEDTPEIGKMCVETNDWGEEEPAYVIDDRPILACAVKTIQTQQEQINTLTTELYTYKALMDKLINSKSFADFKKNID